MKVAVVQMVSSPDVSSNLQSALRWAAQASEQGAELVLLPEYFCGMGVHDADKLQWAEPLGNGRIQQALAQCAKTHKIWLVAGTLPMQASVPSKVRNTSLLFDPEGVCVAYYDKIHLFRYATGTESYDESVRIEAGRVPVVTTIQDRQGCSWTLGLSICYDLRFPELYRQLVAQGAQILLAPSAFTYTTGQAHWELLLRARAIENQCWVLAAAQGGCHLNGRTTWGHSMVVDPWGKVVVEQTFPGEGISYAELDTQILKQVRLRLPALEHRCL